MIIPVGAHSKLGLIKMHSQSVCFGTHRFILLNLQLLCPPPVQWHSWHAWCHQAYIDLGFSGFLAARLNLYNKVEGINEKNTFFQLVGLCILAMITVLWYLAVSQPLKFETLISKRQIYIILAFAKLVCLGSRTPESITETLMEDGLLRKLLDNCKFCFAGFLPLIVIILYGKLLLFVRQQARRIPATEINAEDALV